MWLKTAGQFIHITASQSAIPTPTLPGVSVGYMVCLIIKN
jgi:hypothetical protein